MLSAHLYGMENLARMSKSVLRHPKSLGGRSLPYFQFYYWASIIRTILHWLYEDPGADPL